MARRSAVETCQSTLDLGERLQQMNELARAEGIYLRHLRDDPGNADILVELGLCLVDSRRPDEALDRFNAALSTAPDHARGRYGRAVALERVAALARPF